MEEMIAYCGLNCGECPAYKATVENDDELRKTTAEQWSAMFNADVDWKDINCLGCKSEKNFGHCKECEIRLCGLQKDVHTCGHCENYGCDKISNFLEYAPEAKENLSKIRGE